MNDCNAMTATLLRLFPHLSFIPTKQPTNDPNYHQQIKKNLSITNFPRQYISLEFSVRLYKTNLFIYTLLYCFGMMAGYGVAALVGYERDRQVRKEVRVGNEDEERKEKGAGISN